VDVAERLQVIRELCSFEGRLAGTDAERRAGNWLAGRLRDVGRRVEVEPTHVHPQFALVQAAHCALGFAASLIAIVSPVAGLAIVLLTAVSMYLDLNGRAYLLRRLFFRRASQNVVSAGRRADPPARLLLCANYDAPRTGPFFRPRTIARFAWLDRLSPLPLGPFRILFWSLVALLPILGARLAGAESTFLSIVQLVPTLILLIGILMLVNQELSDVTPGANDNASGVATVLSIADELDANPPENLDVGILFTGGGGCLMEGTRSFLRAHRRRLDRNRTYFLNVEGPGRGEVRYLAGEGFAVSFGMDTRVIQLCEAVASAQGHEQRPSARPLRWGFATSALPMRLARYPCTTITTIEPGAVLPAGHRRLDDVPGRIDPGSLDRAQAFALDLVRALDRDVGRRLSR
jgi:hypothetical protein